MVDRVILGKHPDRAEVGLWVSKATKDARTSTAPDDFHFDPSKYLLRPYLRGEISYVVKKAYQYSQQTTYNGQTVWLRYYTWHRVFAHLLGYPPVFKLGFRSGFVTKPRVDGAQLIVDYYTIGIDGYWTTAGPTGGTLVLAMDNSDVYYDPATDRLYFKYIPYPTYLIWRNPIT